MMLSLLRMLSCIKRYNMALWYHRKGHFFIVCCYVAALCCLQPTLMDYNNITGEGIGGSEYLNSGSAREAYYTRNHAIVVISMGQQAQESQIVERFVWSARHRGEWKGWIVVLTDAPESRYQKLMDESPSTIVMNPLPKDFKPHLSEDMPYKRFKTNVLEYMNRDTRLDSVRFIYYLDVDIVVGNSLVNMMEDLEQRYHIPNPQLLSPASSTATTTTSTSHIWFFEGNFKNLLVQGGQFILDRRPPPTVPSNSGSQGCLEEWRRRIDSEPHQPKDQPHLQQMYLLQQQQQQQQHSQQQSTSTPCQIHIMEKLPHLFFPTNATVTEWAKEIKRGKWFRKRKTLIYPTLVHIKNSGKVREIDQDVERIYLQDLLNLPRRQQEIGTKIHFQPDDNLVVVNVADNTNNTATATATTTTTTTTTQ